MKSDIHPDYHMTDARATTTSDLTRAAIIGQAAGLHYIYAGNLPGLQVNRAVSMDGAAYQFLLVSEAHRSAA